MNKVKENLKAGKTVVGVAGAPNDVTMPLLAESAYDFIKKIKDENIFLHD